jgi:hypothetical protein
MMRHVLLGALLIVIAESSVAQQADLAITFDGSVDGAVCPTAGCDTHLIPVPRGGKIAYSFVLENHGPSAASGVTTTITFPADTTIDTFNGTSGTVCSTSVVAGSPTLTCTTATMNVGDLPNVSFKIVVNQNYAAATVVATGVITSTTADPVVANNSRTVTLPVLAAVPTLGGNELMVFAVALGVVAVTVLRR